MGYKLCSIKERQSIENKNKLLWSYKGVKDRANIAEKDMDSEWPTSWLDSHKVVLEL